MALHARAASRQLQALDTATRVAILNRVAEKLIENEAVIMAENAADVEAATGKINDALLQRLVLKPKKIELLAGGCCLSELENAVVTGRGPEAGHAPAQWQAAGASPRRRTRPPPPCQTHTHTRARATTTTTTPPAPHHSTHPPTDLSPPFPPTPRRAAQTASAPSPSRRSPSAGC